MQSFTFLTLSSGVTIEVPLDPKPLELTISILRLSLTQGGPIPGVVAGWNVGLGVAGGAIYFSITFEEYIVAAGAVVGTQKMAAEYWGGLEELHIRTYDVISMELGNTISDAWLGHPLQPVAAPWVGLVYQPGLLRYPEAAQWIPAFVTALAQATLPILLRE